MPAATRLDSQEPKGPKVMTNITSMAQQEQGQGQIFPRHHLVHLLAEGQLPRLLPLGH